ncbi:hypothetical protein ACFQH6_03470 [Halobacteriaceae archaeon GCM10025711]
MGHSYISFATEDGGTARDAAVKEEVQNIIDYLNSEVNDHEFSFWDFGQVPFLSGDYNADKEGEEQFVHDVLDYLDGNDLTSHENVLIAHEFEEWGYGGDEKYYTTDNNIRSYGAAVFAGSYFTGEWETRGFTWHEAAHAYRVDHADGGFHTVWDSDDTTYRYTDLTPMAWSYLLEPDTGPDLDASTTWEGSGSRPDRFDNGYDNRKYFWENPNHYWDRYSYYTLNEIQDWIDDLNAGLSV